MNDRQLKNYKKYTLVLLLVTTAALIVCAAAFSFKRAAQVRVAKPEAVVTHHYTPKQAASQETPAAEPEGYVVRLQEGKIGVYRRGESAPVLVSEVQAYLLPEGDLELLRAGIPAASLSEARGILEDYE